MYPIWSFESIYVFTLFDSKDHTWHTKQNNLFCQSFQNISKHMDISIVPNATYVSLKRKKNVELFVFTFFDSILLPLCLVQNISIVD